MVVPAELDYIDLSAVHFAIILDPDYSTDAGACVKLPATLITYLPKGSVRF